MSLGILEKINWVDIIAIILTLRITYVGSTMGIGCQILPAIITFFIFYLSFYLYDRISVFILQKIVISESVTRFVVFLSLIILFTVISKLINKYLPIKKPEKLIPIEFIGGALIGFFRNMLIIGLTFAILILMPIEGFAKSVVRSMTGASIVRFDLDMYAAVYNGITSWMAKGKAENSLEKTSSSVLFAELAKKKDFEIKFFNVDIKEKARFFKEEEENKKR